MVFVTLCLLVLSGCGGGKSGKGGGNGGVDDPAIVDFDATKFEGTAWRCKASGNRPEITVNLDELYEDSEGMGCYFTGSVECATTGKISITKEDIAGGNLGNYVMLTSVKIGENLIISFNVGATNNANDYIQIDGVITPSNPDTVNVVYLLVDYDDMDRSDYEYDIESDPEDVELKKVI